MKVLHVINSLYFGGAEKLLLDTIPRFKNKGLEVDILVLHGKKTFFFNELEGKHKIKIITPKNIKSVYKLTHIFFVRKFIKKYTIVHVHLFPSLYWVAIASLFVVKKPKLVFTEHNTHNRRRTIKLFNFLDKFIYNKYDKIITISNAVKQNLEAYLKIENNKIALINNGVDVSFFKNSRPYSLCDFHMPKRAKIIIQVASFTKQKDHNTLLKATALLSDNTHLFLVGSGPLLKQTQELATSLNIEKRVHFLGNRNDVNRLLKTADICILSSHYEGFGISIVEAMASGLPCIGSNVPGLSNVLENAGVSFEKENHLELKNIIEKLLSDTNFYNNVAANCIKRAQEYDISITIEKQIGVYKNLFKNNQRNKR